MKSLESAEIQRFVNENIIFFHQNRIRSLSQLKLDALLKRKNPYLFRAKNLNVAADLIRAVLEAYLSSSEEKLFGDFLEELALFIASRTLDGRKSTAPGIDLEFDHLRTRYLVSIKSGPNWGNSSQQRKQEEDFKDAVKRLKQSNQMLNIQAVLGICYGNTRTAYLRNYMKVVGQNFWYLISGNKTLYTDIIEPLGYRAKQHNEDFEVQKAAVINMFTERFSAQFCDNGRINWDKLVEFSCGNFDLVDFQM